jgi:hypothetical protein
MSNITNFTTVTTNTLLANAINFKSNPSLIQQYILNYLQGITNGQVDIVDPTNPFVFLLEASTVNAAAAMLENVAALQKQYISLARSPEDIYMHMSNSEYIDIFSTPANGTFTFLINKEDVIKNAVPVPGQPYSKVTIAANSFVSVSQYTFTILYPIDILYYNNGSFLVQLDTNRPNPIQPITSFIIPHTTINDPSGTQWLQFNFNINQIVINSEQYSLTASEYFKQNILFNNLYYYTRVFYLDETNLDWVEINTTYTDQVFDPNTPTALIKVLDGSIDVEIPSVYYDNNLIQSNIRIDVYTTLGKIDVNMAAFSVGAYSSQFTAVNQYRINNNPYVSAMSAVSFLWYSTDIISGGNNAVTFSQLQQIKVNNATNGRLLPITNAQAQQYLSYLGFTLVPNIDVVTNRQFKAIAPAPKSSNETLVPTLNTTVLTTNINLNNITSDNKVITYGEVIIITPETVFINTNGQVQFITKSQRAQLTALSNNSLVDTFNTVEYLYTPFYYAINNSTSELIVRAYWMNNPTMQNLNFISNNLTSGYKVSTQSFSITKISNTGFSGYLVSLTCLADSEFLKLDPSEVFCQLAYIPEGQTTYSYMTVNAEPVTSQNPTSFTFNFYISTNFYFDVNNTIDLDSFQIAKFPSITSRTNLSQTFNILYGLSTTPAGFVPDNSNINIFNKNYVSNTACTVTHETIDITFGTYLENLWIKSTLIEGQPSYLTYPEDVPLLYAQDEYQVDPVTGLNFTIQNNEIVYNAINKAGTQVYNANGEPVYQAYAGNPVLDSNMQPYVVSSGVTNYIIDMVFYDGAYKIATDPNVNNYVQLATNTIAEWASTTMAELDNNFFEQTEIKYSPPISVGSISCEIDGISEVSLDASLSPTISVYLPVSDYVNLNYQNQIKLNITNVVRNYLQNTVLSKSVLISLLEEALPNALAVTITGFFDDYGVVVIKDPAYRFVLERINYLESNNVIGVKENISFVFYSVGK